MTNNKFFYKISIPFFISLLVLLLSIEAEAQHMNHRSSGGRSGGGFSKSMNRSGGSHRSINGGHMSSRSKSRNSSSSKKTSNVKNKSSNYNSGNKSTNANSGNRSTNVNSGNKNTNVNSGNRNTNVNTGNKNTNINTGNKNVNVNNSTTNVHVNNSTTNVYVNNSHHTTVRVSPTVYVAPPYHYGGYGYYSHHAYYYHPYTPFFYGPYYHPWGFFITTMVETAIIVSVIDANKKEPVNYYYDNGTYYVKTDKGYTVVQAPVGATVSALPKEATSVPVTETVNNYYYAGAFYEKDDKGYTVVPATAGTIVPHLPDGGEEVKIGDQTYTQFGETYYQPIQVNGKDMYEIVEVKKEGDDADATDKKEEDAKTEK